MPMRHVPERTCIACRLTKPKREMTRVVRGVDGSVAVDPTGKKSGRGAYVCRTALCWEQSLKKRALDRALKTEIDAPTRARLEEHARLQLDASPRAGARYEVEHESTTV